MNYLLPKILVVVVTVDGLAVPEVKVGEGSVLHSVRVTGGRKALRLDLARTIKVRRAGPLHRARVIFHGTEANHLDRLARDGDDLSERGDVGLVAPVGDEDVADLGTVDDFRLGSHNGVHIGKSGEFFRKVKLRLSFRDTISDQKARSEHDSGADRKNDDDSEGDEGTEDEHLHAGMVGEGLEKVKPLPARP